MRTQKILSLERVSVMMRFSDSTVLMPFQDHMNTKNSAKYKFDQKNSIMALC